MSEQKTIQFNDETLIIYKSKYPTKPNRIKLQLFDEQGFPTLTATKNIPKVNINPKIDIKEDETFIKDYAENKGILQVLVDAKIVEDLKIDFLSGFETLNLVKVLI